VFLSWTCVSFQILHQSYDIKLGLDDFTNYIMYLAADDIPSPIHGLTLLPFPLRCLDLKSFGSVFVSTGSEPGGREQ